MFDLIKKMNPFKKIIEREERRLHNLKVMEEYKRNGLFPHMEINDWIAMRDGIIDEELIGKYLPCDLNKELLCDNYAVLHLIKLVGLLVMSENKPEHAAIIKEMNDSFMDKILYGGFNLLDRGRTNIRNSYGEIHYLMTIIKNNVEDKVRLYYTLKLLRNVISVIYHKENWNEVAVQKYDSEITRLIQVLYIPNGEKIRLKCKELEKYLNYLYLRSHGENV